MPGESYYRMTVLVPQRDYRRLLTYAIHHRTTVSSVVRDCVNSHLDYLEGEARYSDWLFDYVMGCVAKQPSAVLQDCDTFNPKDDQTCSNRSCSYA